MSNARSLRAALGFGCAALLLFACLTDEGPGGEPVNPDNAAGPGSPDGNGDSGPEPDPGSDANGMTEVDSAPMDAGTEDRGTLDVGVSDTPADTGPSTPPDISISDTYEAVDTHIEDPNCGKLTLIIRDFRHQHIDMENSDAWWTGVLNGHRTGIVENELGPDGKPVFLASRDSVDSEPSFQTWYTDFALIPDSTPVASRREAGAEWRPRDRLGPRCWCSTLLALIRSAVFANPDSIIVGARSPRQ